MAGCGQECGADLTIKIIPEGPAGEVTLLTGKGVNVSDGYHTFGELYEHRITLWIALCRLVQRNTNSGSRSAWRSRLHSDGTSYAGWFVLGITGDRVKQITYHLPDSRWDECAFAVTLEKCPEFDGHTSADVLRRLADL